MEKINTVEMNGAQLIKGAQNGESGKIKGVYTLECFDKDGNLKWADEVQNVVTNVGKNLTLDTVLAGSTYTVTGPFMGLISSVSYTGAPVIGDTMTSHGTWTEAGVTNAPTYSGGRKTCVFSAASAGSKALSTALAFTFTGSGTVKGLFICTGTGALSTVDNTAGTLLSAGLFTGGDKVVASTDVINVSYTLSL